MSVCGLLLVRDEVDIVRFVIDHTLANVDHLIVTDHFSVDGTREAVEEMRDAGAPITLRTEREEGYFQSRFVTEMADQALGMGFSWVVPLDADELWYATDRRRLGDFLAGLAPDVAFVEAELYNHLPTGEDDPAEANPFRRLGWRQREHGALPKVACRLRPDLEIRAGNHSAWAPGSGVTVGGLCVRHFSWRTREQYVRKIANGARAYAETRFHESVGAHWRMFGDPDDPTFDERVGDHFDTWFFVEEPRGRDDLIFDPAPVAWPPSAEVGVEVSNAGGND